MRDQLLGILLSLPAVLLAITVHEYAHALAAYKAGDTSQKFSGRLTLNPIKHIDPLGFIALLLFRFGWAKPVQVQPGMYKNRKRDELIVALAGVCANVLVGIIFAIIYRVYLMIMGQNLGLYLSSSIFQIIQSMLFAVVSINIGFAIFNLIPIPPLDGFKVLLNRVPRVAYEVGDFVGRYQLFILLGLLMPIFNGSSLIGLIISPILRLIMGILI